VQRERDQGGIGLGGRNGSPFFSSGVAVGSFLKLEK
jgi:hypothetical protein